MKSLLFHLLRALTLGLIGKLSWDITTTQINSAFHPSGVAKSSTSFSWGKDGKVTAAGWQVTLCDPIWRVISRSLPSQTVIFLPFTFTFNHCYRGWLKCDYAVVILVCSVAVGTGLGYGVVDYAQKKSVFEKCTLGPPGHSVCLLVHCISVKW